MNDGTAATAVDRTVRVGSRVRVRDEDGDEDLSIVPPEQVDLARGHISMDCPLGRALLGHVTGEVVTVRAPGGARPVTIVSVD